MFQTTSRHAVSLLIKKDGISIRYPVQALVALPTITAHKPLDARIDEALLHPTKPATFFLDGRA
jgi:hypothetical protein